MQIATPSKAKPQVPQKGHFIQRHLCQGYQLEIHTTTKDLVANCLKVKPSDGSTDTEFHMQRH